MKRFLAVVMSLFSLTTINARADFCSDIFPSATNENSTTELTPLVMGGSDVDVGDNYTMVLAGGQNHSYSSITAGERFKLNITGNGTARLHVNGDLELDDRARINDNGNPEDLIIYVRGDIKIGEKASINAIIYAGGDIEMDEDGITTGAITANGDIDLDDHTVVFDSNAINNADFAGMCEVGSASVTATFLDRFNTVAYNNQDGEQNWLSDWVETNDDGSPASGDIEISGGELHLQNKNVAITRSVNLSAYTTATLSFNYREVSLDNANEWVDLQIRTGGSGSWTQLQRFAGPHNDSGNYTVDISDYIDELTELRLITAPSLNKRDHFYVDDFAINALGSASPNPVGAWHFEQASWNGTANEVIDSSGNNLHGRARSGATTGGASPDPAITGDPGTCFYGDFAGNNEYVEVADNNLLDMTTELTVAVWIYPRGFPSSDLHTIVSKDTNYEFHLNTSRQIYWWWNDSSGVTRSFNTTGAQLTANRWQHIAIVYRSGSQKIYIDGVERGTATYNGNLITNNSPLLIANDIGYTNTRNFNGAIDEVLIYDTALTEIQIDRIRLLTHPCEIIAGPDHFSISHSGTAVNCQAEIVTISAHSDDHTVDTNYVGSVMLSTSTNHGDWSLLDGSSIVSGSDSGVASYHFSAADNGIVQLLLRNTHPETVNINVTDGAVSELTGTALNVEDLNLIFSPSGFRFYDGTETTAIATQLSGKNSNISDQGLISDLFLQAINTDTDTGACEAFLTGSQNIEFSFDCINPSSCTATEVLINGSAIPESGSGTRPIILDFGAATDDAASFIFNYDEAGLVRLNASFAMAPTGVIAGSSNNFVTKPAGFCVSAADMDGAGPRSPICINADEDCTPYVAAGDNFNLEVSARAWRDIGETNSALCDNTITANFLHSNIILSSAVVAPATGVDGQLSVDNVAIVSGGAVNILQTIDEVGVFNFTATPILGYLGQPMDASSSANIGRFIAHHFELLSGSVTAANTGAVDFTYLGQPFFVDYTLAARSGLSPATTTKNYTGDFAKLDINSHGVIGDAVDVTYGAVETVTPASLNARLTSSGLSPSWNNGTVSVILLPLTIGRGVSLEGPIAEVDIGLMAIDSDGAALINTDLNTSTITGNDAVKIADLAGTLRYGRTFIAPVYGPEIATGGVSTTPIPFENQFYNGSHFEKNIDDNNSNYGTGSTMSTVLGMSNYTGNLTATDLGASDVTFPGLTTLIAGMGDGIAIGRPGLNKQGSVDVTFSVEPWLQFDWDDSVAGDENPSTTINFGRYRGHDRVIYWREVH